MAKAKAIVNRRKVVVNTRKITKTMELVSTARFKQSFSRVTNAGPYRDSLQDMMQDLASTSGEVQHPLLVRRDPVRRVTLLLLTSNRGLAGGFNSNLIKTCRSFKTHAQDAGATVDLHVAGKKGLAYFRYAGEPVTGRYTHFGDSPVYEDVQKLADDFLKSYTEAQTDQVAICYQKYESAGVQRPHVAVLLPIEPPHEDKTTGARSLVDYLYSPDAQSLLRALLPAYFKTSLYHVFLENVVGEHRARMVAMKNATDSAETMIKTLTRMYNRARQAQITNELSEIMGGVEALK